MFQRFFAMFCGFNSRESEGLMSKGLMSEGLMSKGLMSEGLILLSDADYL
jgi:hypothetical protein